MRSDSFTRSSAASRISVVPRAVAASTTSAGTSSMSRGMSGPAIVVAARGAWPTVSAAIGSPAASPGPCGVVASEARMAASTSSRPVRVGFTPTRRTVTRASGTMRPATRRKAADEMSPGTWTAAARSGPGCNVTVRASGRSSRAPNARSITSE